MPYSVDGQTTNNTNSKVCWFGPWAGMASVILQNAVTSPGTLLNGYSVEIVLHKSPIPILHCLRLLGENIAGQGYWVTQNCPYEGTQIPSKQDTLTQCCLNVGSPSTTLSQHYSSIEVSACRELVSRYPKIGKHVEPMLFKIWSAPQMVAHHCTVSG